MLVHYKLDSYIGHKLDNFGKGEPMWAYDFNLTDQYKAIIEGRLPL
jgi:hypothetical protein